MDGKELKERIMKSWKRKNKNCKQAVLDCIQDMYPAFQIDNIEELENIENFPGCTEDQFMEIEYILDKTYPKYTPYYLYKFSYKNGKTEEDLYAVIIQNNELRFREGNGSWSINNRFCIEKNEVKKVNNNIGIKMTIAEYNVKYDYLGNEKPGSLKNREDITMTFYGNESALYINTGKETLANFVLKNYLINNFFEYINIEPLKISNFTLNNIEIRNPDDDKTTILMLELITNKLKNNPFNVNDYIKVGISNRGEDNIKSITVRGNDLLKENDVADKLNSGFSLKNAELKIEYYDGNVYIAGISIIFQSTVKVVITEGENNNKNHRIINYIFEEIQSLCTNELVVESIMEKYFSTIITQRAAQKSIFLDEVKNEVRNEIPEIISKWNELKRILERLY